MPQIVPFDSDLETLEGGPHWPSKPKTEPKR